MVLVGRPNVGKSTLFNRITRTRRAIVNAMAGTTRDVLAHDAEWQGTPFRLVDTGGIFGHTEDPLHDMVVEHGKRAILQADLIIFVVDGREGRVSGDDEIAAEMRRVAQAPVLLAVNKADDKRARDRMYEFFAFGFDHVFEIAAEHGTGVHDLMDAVLEQLKAAGKLGGSVAEEEPDEIAVAIVGRPNVGKSSIVNRLLREERLIVSDIPGTTRDAIDTLLRWHKRTFRIVDTAGIRRPGRVADSHTVEMVSVLTAKRAMERADVAVLVIDAAQGATDQDAAIAGEASRLGCGMIIAANKWDLTKGEGDRYYKDFDEEQRFRMKFLDYAPLLHISALTGERAPKLLETVDRVADGAPQAHHHGRTQPLRRARRPRAPAVDPGQAAREDPLRRADRRGAAAVRVLHQRRHGVPLLVRALPHQQPARDVRLRGVADQNHRPQARRQGAGALVAGQTLTPDA